MYSGDPKTGRVRISNGQKQVGCGMVRFSDPIRNSDKKVRFSNGKNHLKTGLFFLARPFENRPKQDGVIQFVLTLKIFEIDDINDFSVEPKLKTVKLHKLSEIVLI